MVSFLSELRPRPYRIVVVPGEPSALDALDALDATGKEALDGGACQVP